MSMCSVSSRKFRQSPGDVNPPGQGADPGPSHGSSKNLPTLHQIFKGEAEAARSVQLSARTVHPAPLLYQKNSPRRASLSGENTLLEAALAPGMPPGLFLPYPCNGHFSPPSPSSASFKRAASPDPAARSPP